MEMAEADVEFVERASRTPCGKWPLIDHDRLFTLARRGAAVPWRPIEEAPKDGTEFIAYRPDAGVFTASYDPEQECWFANHGYEDITDDQPTHWMPLPPPPSGDPRDE